MPPTQYTPEQIEDFKNRSEGFQEDFKALTEKYQVELVRAIGTVPSPSGVFGLGVTESIGDLKYKPVPSPFTPTETPDEPAAPTTEPVAP